MSKDTTFSVRATVTKYKSYTSDKFKVKVEGSGYEGEGDSYSVGTAFEDAYRDLMMKVSEAIFTNE